MRTTDLHVGLIGYGGAGATFHAPLVASVTGMRLDTIVTADPERAARASADHPGAVVVADVRSLLARGPDLVVIATPNRTHVALATQAIDAGVAVVIDKPIATTAAEARHLVERAAARQVALTVFHNRRWDGDFLTVGNLLADGRMGTVARFESRFERWRPVVNQGWRERPGPAEAGGVLFDLGPHLVDQALRLFGPAVTVYAEIDRRRPGAEVDDDSFVALTHASGVRSHLWMSATAAQPGARFRVLGDAGALTTWGLDGQEAALRGGWRPGEGSDLDTRSGRLGAEGATEEIPLAPGDYQAFYRGMMTTLRHGEPPPVEPADAVAGLEVIEAARRSAASGLPATV